MSGEIFIQITDSEGNLDPNAVGDALNDVFGRIQTAEANQALTTRLLKAITDNIDGPISTDLAKALKGGNSGWAPIAAAALPLLASRNQATATAAALPGLPTSDRHAVPWTVQQQSTAIVLSAAAQAAGMLLQYDTASTPSDRFARVRVVNGAGLVAWNASGRDLFTVTYQTLWDKIPRVDMRVELDQANVSTNVFATDTSIMPKNEGLLTGFTVQQVTINTWAVGAGYWFTFDTCNRPGET